MLELILLILKSLSANAEILVWLGRKDLHQDGDRKKVTDFLASLRNKTVTSTPEAAETIVALAREVPGTWAEFLKGNPASFISFVETQLDTPPQLTLVEEPVDEGPAGWDENKSYASQKDVVKGAIRKFLDDVAATVWGNIVDGNRARRRILNGLRKNGAHTDRATLRELVKKDHAERTGTTTEKTPAAKPATAPAKPAPSSWEHKKFRDLDEPQRAEFRQDLREIAKRLIPDDFENAMRTYYRDAEQKNWSLSRHGIEKQLERGESYQPACDNLKRLLRDKFDSRRLDNPSFQQLASKIANGMSLEEAEGLIRDGFYDWE